MVEGAVVPFPPQTLRHQKHKGVEAPLKGMWGRGPVRQPPVEQSVVLARGCSKEAQGAQQSWPYLAGEHTGAKEVARGLVKLIAQSA
jgi:hypothetical protein